MRKALYLVIIMLSSYACSKTESNDIAGKKRELEKARNELAELNKKIRALEKEISAVDPDFARQVRKTIPISVIQAVKKPFEHMLEVRGAIESRTNVVINAQAAGEIKHVHVREGQLVKAGQLLVSLDTEILQNTLAELEASLALAVETYERQARLWQQKVGTEMQYLQAKSNKESLEHRIATLRAQIEQAMVRAPFSGTVDELPAKTGMVVTPGVPLVRLVGREQMYVKADVSEKFIGRFKAGDRVNIYFPAMEKRLASSVASVGQVINPENRTFTVEVTLPVTGFAVKPNQVVILELSDYVNKEAFAVPTRIIQRDEEGQFIYLAEESEGRIIARKRYVITGVTSGNLTEITDGLREGDRIVEEGYRDLVEGVEVEIVQPKADTLALKIN
ncbi:MAG: MexH family multidrug efflux RND transporter periplasmic adaptor subunit [Cyclobacteriaceae bacterium]|nr:MAG: MexH family multidrug efflux RND transporter periplasmic adaptor subunit [Cyclobacteriaceae bacterium]